MSFKDISPNSNYQKKRLVDFNGDWPVYKKYLYEHGNLSPNLTVDSFDVKLIEDHRDDYRK